MVSKSSGFPGKPGDEATIIDAVAGANKTNGV